VSRAVGSSGELAWRASSLTPSSLVVRTLNDARNATEVVDIRLGGGEGLNVHIEIGILQAHRPVEWSLTSHSVPGAVVKVGSRHQHVRRFGV